MIIQLTEEEWQKKREEIISQVVAACRSGDLPNTDLFNQTDYDIVSKITDIYEDLEHLKDTSEINKRLVEENRKLKQDLSPLKNALDGTEVPPKLPTRPSFSLPKKKKKWWQRGK